MFAVMESFESLRENLLPGQSVDCVIFGFHEGQLHVLLLKWKGSEQWMLPGGFIFLDEHLDSAARRVLEERTGLKSIFLRQFYTFGNTNRRKLSNNPDFFRSLNAPGDVITWLSNRFITTGYIAFVKMDDSKVRPDPMSDKVDWVPINSLPKLIFDHHEIVEKAQEHLRIQLNYLPISRSLLRNKFTMTDLQALYEAILNRPLDRGNFQKKMLKLGIFQRHEKQLNGRAHKAPYLYSFDDKKYDELVVQGFGFI